MMARQRGGAGGGKAGGSGCRREVESAQLGSRRENHKQTSVGRGDRQKEEEEGGGVGGRAWGAWGDFIGDGSLQYEGLARSNLLGLDLTLDAIRRAKNILCVITPPRVRRDGQQLQRFFQ
jgi:hypothetical protein